MRTNGSVSPHPPVHLGSERHEEDFMTGQMIAGKLNETVEWVNSMCRRRSSNPMPFHNAGSRRFFLYSEVHAWIMNSPKVVHSQHRRRTKTEIAVAISTKKKKGVEKNKAEGGANGGSPRTRTGNQSIMSRLL
jgi:hypothetical protein